MGPGFSLEDAERVRRRKEGEMARFSPGDRVFVKDKSFGDYSGTILERDAAWRGVWRVVPDEHPHRPDDPTAFRMAIPRMMKKMHPLEDLARASDE